MKTTGTLTTKVMVAKKTGRKFIYEVYTTANGDLHVARLIEWAGGVVTKPIWGDPCDSESDAIKSAFHTFRIPFNERAEREAEYRRSGGY
jgi:hypothetical protein